MDFLIQGPHAIGHIVNMQGREQRLVFVMNDSLFYHQLVAEISCSDLKVTGKPQALMKKHVPAGCGGGTCPCVHSQRRERNTS